MRHIALQNKIYDTMMNKGVPKVFLERLFVMATRQTAVMLA